MDIPKNIKWILIAVLLFAVGHYLIKSAANNLSLSNPSFTEYMSWLNALALALYFICGVVASYLNKKQFLFTGTVTGFLSAITAMFIFNVAVNDVSGKVITLVTGIILGAIGGAVAKLLTRRWVHAL
jgi:MFS-type transporter involved in bile tolerance (Atg22 family)